MSLSEDLLFFKIWMLTQNSYFLCRMNSAAGSQRESIRVSFLLVESVANS